MGIAFSRTTRALHADHGRASVLALRAALVLLALWAAWFALARVTVYEVSRSAHIEVSSSSRDIATLQGGKLVASGLFVGRRVRAGEVLAEMDAQQQKLRLAEAEARLSGYPARVAALRREQAMMQVAQSGSQRAGSAELSAARDRTREAQANAEFGRSMAQRQQDDSASGGSSPADAERAETDSRKASAARDVSRHEELRIAGSASVSGAEHAADAARISADLASVTSDQAATGQLVAQLRYELEQRLIRAPVDGIIGAVAPLKLGEVLGSGSRLATIVPDGDLHIVAAFDPATGLGRLASGQDARLRLDGFSWAQYGDFPARVERVAAETSGNVLRVELRMPRRRDEDLPLRHGMTGQVEVAIDRVSPAILLLRSIGLALS